MGLKFVSIIVPTLNEAGFIQKALCSLVSSLTTLDYEVLVIDGGSSDRTIAIVEDMARENPRIRLVHNERRLQSAAVNLGVKVANPAARIIVRADSHAIYPDGFIERCTQTLLNSKAQSVVVTMKTVGVGCFQRGVAAAQNSVVGNGGALHRRRGGGRFVDHGHHAAFDRDFFERLGGYDGGLKANEDVDYDVRLGRAGGRIWLETSVPVTYYPRDSPVSLARQYHSHGIGRALTYRRYRYKLKLRQILPAFLLAGNVTCLLGAVLLSDLFLIPPLLYVLGCLGLGVVTAVSKRDRCRLFLGVAAMIMHHAWAIGFFRGLSFPLDRRHPLSSAQQHSEKPL